MDGTVNVPDHGNGDVWLVRLNDQGDMLWQRKYGGPLSDVGNALAALPDGGLLFTASIGSMVSGGDIAPGMGGYWLVRVDSTGEILWQNRFGGSSNVDNPFGMSLTSDGGCIITGTTWSNDGDVTGYHPGANGDGWVVKVDSMGQLQWQKALGGSSNDILLSVVEAADGGYMTVGFTESNDGDVSGHHGEAGNADGWAVKLDNGGNMVWQRTLGGSWNDQLSSVVAMPDGGFEAAGSTRSTDGDIPYNLGGVDGWVLKLDSAGNLVWTMILGGSADDQFWKVIRTSDGGFLLGGSSTSNDGDATGNHGMEDMWVVKLGPDPAGILEREAAIPLAVYPNPAVEEAHLQFTLRAGGTVRLEVLNLAGQAVLPPVEMHKQPGLQDIPLPTGALPPGAYQVRIITPEGTAVRGLVKVQ